MIVVTLEATTAGLHGDGIWFLGRQFERHHRWQSDGSIRFVRIEGDQALVQHCWPAPTQGIRPGDVQHRFLSELLQRFPLLTRATVAATIEQTTTYFTVSAWGLAVDPRPVVEAAGIEIVDFGFYPTESRVQFLTGRRPTLSAELVDLARRIATVLAVLEQITIAGDILLRALTDLRRTA